MAILVPLASSNHRHPGPLVLSNLPIAPLLFVIFNVISWFLSLPQITATYLSLSLSHIADISVPLTLPDSLLYLGLKLPPHNDLSVL